MNNNLNTINIFIESCRELGIGLSEDISEKIIIDAYNKIITQHSNAILKGINPPFEIQIKIHARDYLLNSIKSKS
jgi:hypothetical protein